MFNIQHNKGEPVKKFITRFYRAVLNIEDTAYNTIIKAFTRSISLIEHHLYDYMTWDNLYTKSYSSLDKISTWKRKMNRHLGQDRPCNKTV